MPSRALDLAGLEILMERQKSLYRSSLRSHLYRLKLVLYTISFMKIFPGMQVKYSKTRAALHRLGRWVCIER